MVDISSLIAHADSLYRQGNYPGTVETLYPILRSHPEIFESDAAAFVASFPKSERSHFWTLPRPADLDQGDLKAVFEFIYERKVWGEGSGGGSDLRNVVLYIACLQALMDRHDVRSIIDIGCGDWRFSRYLNFDGRDYLGLDVVSSVIASNASTYGTSNIKFERADISEVDDLPACDLIICKDVLQHLSNENVIRALKKFRAARFALITNDYHPANVDIANGGTRPLDVSRPPFNFPARPVCRFQTKVCFLMERTSLD